MRSAIRVVSSSRSGFLATMSNPPYPDEFKNYIPEPYLTAIGMVCVNWGMLEAAVDLTIEKLAGFDIYDSRGAIVMAHMTWALKMDIIEALVNALLQDHPHLAKLDVVKPLLKKAQEGRNRIVHGHWGEDNRKIHKLRVTARAKLRIRMDEIVIEDIEAIAADIGRAGSALLKLVLNQ
jgi:hypothetical protein